jgi:hypothetical protein
MFTPMRYMFLIQPVVMKNCFFLLFAVVLNTSALAQACTPAGNQTSYGVADTWIGYVYDNTGFSPMVARSIQKASAFGINSGRPSPQAITRLQ